MIVKLTLEEGQEATRRGCQRRLRALRLGRQHRHGYDGADNWTAHIEAVGSEMAVAKLLGRYYVDTADPDYGGDVGARLQVRHTTLPNGRLIVHPSDPDDHFYVLVTGELPTYEVVGGLYARDCKREEWWTDPGTGRPAFFVPRDALKPLRTRAEAA